MIRYLFLAAALLSTPSMAHDHARLAIEVRSLLDGHLGIGVGGRGLDVGVGVKTPAGDVDVGVGIHTPPPSTSGSPPSHPPPDKNRLRAQVNALSDTEYARLRKLCAEVEALAKDPDHPSDADLLWLCKFVQAVKR